MNNGLIYRAVFEDGNSYVGQTLRSLQERRKEHEDMRSKSLLSRTLHEYGTRNCKWEILEENVAICDLNNKEKYYISILKPTLNVYLKRRTFTKTRMMAGRIEKSLADELKAKLKSEGKTVQDFMNAIVHSINSGFDMRTLYGKTQKTRL